MAHRHCSTLSCNAPKHCPTPAVTMSKNGMKLQPHPVHVGQAWLSQAESAPQPVSPQSGMHHKPLQGGAPGSSDSDALVLSHSSHTLPGACCIEGHQSFKIGEVGLQKGIPETVWSVPECRGAGGGQAGWARGHVYASGFL